MTKTFVVKPNPDCLICGGIGEVQGNEYSLCKCVLDDVLLKEGDTIIIDTLPPNPKCNHSEFSYTMEWHHNLDGKDYYVCTICGGEFGFDELPF